MKHQWTLFSQHALVCLSIAVLALSQAAGSAPALADGDLPDAGKSQDTQKLASELKNFQDKASKHNSFRADFEQLVFSALRKKTTKSKGQLFFAQPKKFRWEIATPGKELYVNNGEWFWKYVENTKHAMRMPANAGELDFLDVVFHLDKLPEKFSLKKLNTWPDEDAQQEKQCPAKHTCFALEPIQKGGQKSIALAVNQNTGFVSRLRIEFKNGNKTNITFNSFSPEKVASDLFEFSPPPGTAVDKR
ncbi:MAG: outer rane lipoprotein chaperone LolA [Pseudomonadota bacterium]|jgi:outer membrane lipoprotein carrier protein